MNLSPSKLNIKPITPAALPLLREAFAHYRGRLCDISPGNALFWRDYYDISYLGIGQSVALHYGENRFSLPYGADAEDAIAYLLEAYPDAVFVNLTREEAERFSGYRIESAGRDFCDYLYDAQSIITLKGKKYAGQRNHINKFKSLYPDAYFCEPDLPLARDFCRDYFEDFGKKTAVSDYEYAALLHQLDNWDAYGQVGGMLVHEGKAIALSVGEIVGDTLIIHTEKADIRYAGAYPMMVQSFAAAFAQNVRYINREEDMGLEGLRTSKLSYHPTALLEKFTATRK